MRPFGSFVALLIIVTLSVRALVLRRRESRVLRELARRRRLSFSPEDIIDVQGRYHALELISRGHSRHACHLLYGVTDVGPVALFHYVCDLGFGVNRSTQRWWLAVVESASLHDAWQASPAAPNATDDELMIAGYRVRTERERTLPRLRDAGLEAFLAAAPPGCHFEVRGPLLAVGSAYNPDPAVADQVLDTACDLARRLQPGPAGQSDSTMNQA